MKNRIWKLACYSLFAIGAIGLAATFSLSIHYGNTNPTAPEQGTGHVYPHNYHGRVVFLTEQEFEKLRLAQGALIVGVVGFILIAVLADPFGFKKR